MGRRPFGALLLAASTGWAAGCGSPGEPTEVPGESDVQQRLTTNRQRFAAQVGPHYTYDYQNICFCIVDTTRTVTVTVRDGVRAAVVAAQDGTPLPPDRWHEFLTVDEVFDEIQHAIDVDAATIDADYHGSLGYPQDVYLDFDEQIADEERGFTIRRLVVD